MEGWVVVVVVEIMIWWSFEEGWRNWKRWEEEELGVVGVEFGWRRR